MALTQTSTKEVQGGAYLGSKNYPATFQMQFLLSPVPVFLPFQTKWFTPQEHKKAVTTVFPLVSEPKPNLSV